jgi:FKBP-type peptidyl-prolyl cis-trans isomerase
MRLIPTCAALAALTLGSSVATSVLAAEPVMDEAARMQYALGYQLGRDLVAIEPRPQDLLKGLEDGRSGKAKLSDQEMGAALAGLQQKVTEQRAKEQAAASEKAVAAGKAYLAANAGKPGVTTTASGLQYQ